MKKIISIFIFAFVIIASIFILFVKGKTPLKIIEDKFKIDLPKSIEIVKFTNKSDYFAPENDSCAAKLLVSNNDIEYIIGNLNGYTKNQEIILDQMPHEEAIVEWWDLNKNNLAYCYNRYEDKKTLFTTIRGGTSVVYITKDINEKSYIYLCQMF